MSRVVAGTRAVMEALKGRTEIAALFVLEGEDPPRELLAAAEKRKLRPESRSRAELDSLAGGVKHQNVIAIAGEYAYVDIDDVLDALSHPPLVVALDEITDPHNFGAIVRTAVALGADAVITLKDRASPVTPVVVRASAGATEHARIARVVNLARTLAALHERGLEIVGLAGEADRTLSEIGAAPAGRVLVVGSEGKGLRRLVRERCDVLARIPMQGPIASLNASVAAAIALYEAARLRV